VRAVVIRTAGGPGVLGVADLPVPEPGPGEVRLAVRAAAVNPADLELRARAEPRPAPWVPGMDAAGTVDAVGEGVERLVPGEHVMAVVNPFGPHGGAQAERVVVPAASVVRAPAGVGLAQAATLPMNGLTAMTCLDLLGPAHGRTLLVTGGAGHLASFVVPLSKDAGWRVVADARPQDEPAVRALGADEGVPRGDALGAAVRGVLPDGADAAVDTAALQRRVVPALRDGAVLVDVKGWEPGPLERGIRVERAFVYTAFGRTDWLEELARKVASGRLRLPVPREVAPPDVGAVHERVGAGGQRGRTVVVL